MTPTDTSTLAEGRQPEQNTESFTKKCILIFSPFLRGKDTIISSNVIIDRVHDLSGVLHYAANTERIHISS